MNKIKHITRLLMCGVVSILLALSFNVKGVNELNSGQSNLTNKVYTELEFPNIIVEKETDWNNKLGVDFTAQDWQNATWYAIFADIFKKFPSGAHIIVCGNALGLLTRNYSSNLLPSYIAYTTSYEEIGKKGTMVMHISKSGDKLKSDITLRYIVDGNKHYSFSMSFIEGALLSRWLPNRSIELYRSDGSIQNQYNTLYLPKDDKLEFEITIFNLPLLNPIMQGETIKAYAVSSSDYFDSTSTDFKFSFTAFHSGKDSDGNEWRIVFSGDVSVYFQIDGGATKPYFGLRKKSLWIQIYKKAPDDLTYTMTHREEQINTENCYISAIRLLP